MWNRDSVTDARRHDLFALQDRIQDLLAIRDLAFVYGLDQFREDRFLGLSLEVYDNGVSGQDFRQCHV